MTPNQDLIDQLRELLHFKKSKSFYAEKLGCTVEEINSILLQLKYENIKSRVEEKIDVILEEVKEELLKFEENVKEGTGEMIFNSPNEIKTIDELITKCNIDIEKWNVVRYVQNYWGNASQPHWQVKAWLSLKSPKEVYQETFIEFLATYQPKASTIIHPKEELFKTNGCLLINKQDAHLNKLDITGDNNIVHRFNSILHKTEIILNQASLSNNLEKIIYVLGSDEFNSEWTGLTTKGTSQDNILTYHTSFEQICDHEIDVITMLLQYSKNVEIVFVSGNHDEYAGWHLVNWLKMYFRNIDRLTFDISPRYRKYVSYGQSAMMFNHGDAIKDEKLAGIFPIEYKKEWSQHTEYLIFTGDKHTELSKDINGIKFFRIPAFSTTTNKWEDKNGYTTSRGEATAFLIDEQDGLTNIFKQYL